MSNQTLRKPPTTQSAQGKGRSKASGTTSGGIRYRRQTARGGIEYRRDGQPLLFGWGRHLSRIQKNRIRTRAAYGFFGVIVAAVLGVFLFGVLQQTVLIPNSAIVTVNSTKITQDTFRKTLAYRAQMLWNKLQNEISQETQAKVKAQSGDPVASQQDQALISVIQTDESSYQQSAITQDVINRLIEDQLIQQGIAQFEVDHVAASTFAVSDKDVNTELAAFKKGFPSGETYQQFLDSNHMSNDDVLTAIRIDLRRNAMQKYLSSLLVSPMLHVHLRRIELDTTDHANKVRAEILKDPSDKNWATLAKQNSLDVTTKTVGGDMGWIFRGSADAAIENWAFGAGVKVNDISPVIKDTSGTFDIIQFLGSDPKRAVDPAQLSGAQANALDHWLSGQKALANAHISTANQDMLTAARNMPVKPDLNAQLPSYSSGVPNPPIGGGGLP